MSNYRFLCDEMLQGLARWLRVAGYDTLVTKLGMPDRDIIQQALDSGRILITRDRKLIEIRHAKEVALLLQSNELSDCIRELTDKLQINWQLAQFSRCILCNTPLLQATQQQRLRAPEEISASGQEVLYCPSCDKVFWEGGHTKRMRRALARYTEQVNK